MAFTILALVGAAAAVAVFSYGRAAVVSQSASSVEVAAKSS